MWTHAELVQGTFSFDDLMDAHEYLDNKAANEASARAWADAQRSRR